MYKTRDFRFTKEESRVYNLDFISSKEYKNIEAEVAVGNYKPLITEAE